MEQTERGLERAKGPGVIRTVRARACHGPPFSHSRLVSHLPHLSNPSLSPPLSPATSIFLSLDDFRAYYFAPHHRLARLDSPHAHRGRLKPDHPGSLHALLDHLAHIIQTVITRVPFKPNGADAYLSLFEIARRRREADGMHECAGATA